ncbi:hypothetical protein JL108_08815 [Aeromicrobium sp. YIM 150415]|uniref:hypothetical protein n=1 Tax=Aeromicrobium sp. YIM 150415 TaxID=2803912 RepID=UPI0019631CA7|nr:hypothetical protein [Aeromicrobium sp. YIM 150415]MBM9463552.1 hypothetical protein [Aeromicrobium sp. YIM 150415]
MNGRSEHAAIALRTLLRTRVDSVKALSEESDLSIADLRPALAELAEAGHLSVAGDRVELLPPLQAAQRRILAVTEQAHRALETVSATIEDLPTLLADWQAGSTAGAHGDLFSVEVLNGAQAVTSFWSRTGFGWADASKPVRILSPSLAFVDDFGVPDVSAADDYMRDHAIDARCLLPLEAVTEPPDGRDFAALIAPTAQVRLARRVPSWFIVHGDTVAVPLSWGEPRLSSMLVITSASLARLAAEFFDELWHQGVPFAPADDREEAPDWSSLLELMTQSATVQGAARALGISERTARRRLAAAMRHYEVDGLFALGAAWQRTDAPE